MEDNTQKQNKIQQFYQQVQTSFFNIMFELLKEKTTGVFFGCLMILIAFTQLIGLIFEPLKYGWHDQFFLNLVVNICSYTRLIGAINDAGSVFFYWVLMIFGFVYILVMIGLLAFMNYFLRNRKHYTDQVVVALRVMVILMYWVFYQPFFESFISIVNCQADGKHYMDTSLMCYQGIHIFMLVMCIIFLALLFSVNIVIALLYNETQPIQDDCFSRMETNFELAFIVYRSLASAFGGFCSSDTCSWILITAYIIASGLQCFQYYKQVPFYNSFVSIFMGSVLFSYFWISINALLMKFLSVDGHIIVIIVGIPLIVLLVRSLREYRIETLMKIGIEKLNTDIDSLIQVHKMADFARGSHRDQQERMTIIGVINLHVSECQNIQCPCQENYELFDVKTNDFQERNYGQMHQDEVFLSHYIKKLYDDALNKFITSPAIHISFSFYLFKSMRNIHQSLLELNVAQKKKPSLQQQFTIFRYKNIIEEFIQQDHLDHKEVYPQLTNVIDFERLFNEMQKTIDVVSTLQVEFWTHLTTLVPDLNILNELGKKVYIASDDVDKIWNQLCAINPNYQHALSLYGEYLKDIRNHEHLGTSFIEKGMNNLAIKKVIDETAQNSDVLFSDDTTVLHVSGNKESIGKILNASKGLSKVFGYSKNEVVGHSINILMPAIFARLHTEFLERFFRTGRQIIFYQERALFATHRNGNCFSVKILVKQFPNLTEGIQYVGMLKPIKSDFEYFITDMDGVIDSFTKGITSLLGISPNIFKDKDSQINIQIIAPELISFFQDTINRVGRLAKSKFREPGGEPLTLIVPQDFSLIAKIETRETRTSKGRGHKNQQQNGYWGNRSKIFKKFLKALQKESGKKKKQSASSANKYKMPTAEQILQQPEYIKFERKKDVQCEIMFNEFMASKTDSTKLLIFKISRNVVVKDHQGLYGAEMLGEGASAIAGIKLSKLKSNTPQFKQNDIEDISNKIGDIDSIDSDDQRPFLHNIDADVIRQVITAFSNQSLKKVVGFQENPGFKRDPTQFSKRPYSDPETSNQAKLSVVNAGSIRDRLASQSIDKKSFGTSNQEFNASQQSQVDEEDNEDDQDIYSLKSKNMPIPKEEENEDDIETPRVDIQGLKLDPNQQREKDSFFEELKKQSFLMSGNSTNKFDAQANLNVTDLNKQEKMSFEKQNKDLFNDEDSSKLSSNSDHHNRMSSMAKKKQNQLILGRLLGDDEEPQDYIGGRGDSQSIINEDSEREENDSMLSEVIDSQNDSAALTQQIPIRGYEESVKASALTSYWRCNTSVSVKASALASNSRCNTSKNGGNSKIGTMQLRASLGSKTYNKLLAPELSHIGENFNNTGSIKQGDSRQNKNNQLFESGQNGTLKNSKNENIYYAGENKHLMKKRATNKIKTNPRYNCDDEGSGNDTDDIKNEDYQILCSQEIDFRETIIKQKKKRVKKERKMKEKELKKLRAINGEDGTTDGGNTTSPTPGESDGSDEDKSSTPSSSSSSSEDSKDNSKPSGQSQGIKKLNRTAPSHDDGDISSVSTRRSKTERNHYILRTAIDEKYVPQSIRNLRYAAYLIFLILALLSIVYYVIELSLFSNMNQNIVNIHNSEMRMSYIIDITLRTRTLTIINQNYIDNSTLNNTMSALRESATNLKQAQTDLSAQTASLREIDPLSMDLINPSDVSLQYKQYQNMPNQYSLSMWEAIMEIIVSAFRISTLTLKSVIDSEPSVYFVIKNCLNSVLTALTGSTDAIIKESDTSRAYDMSTFLYLLIAASLILVISLIFLIPVINKVKKNKQEVLELFTNRSIDKHIDDQLKVCRNFISLHLQHNNDAAGAAENNNVIDQMTAQQQAALGDKELQNELNGNVRKNKKKGKGFGKKWKRLNNDFGYTLLKFLLFIAVIEGYFLANYLLSSTFLNEVSQLTEELKLLISRQPTRSFLLLSQYELIYSNGTALISGQIAEEYVPSYLETVYDEEEALLDMFSSNFNYHSHTYNNMFNGIVYSNLCDQVQYSDQKQCYLFNQGILTKGLYSSVINYWDYLRQLSHDFINSPRSTNKTLNATITQFLNDPRLIVAQQMQYYYFKIALTQLVSQLEEDINAFFASDQVQSRTIFIIYIFYIALLYVIVWLKFVEQLQNELWKTKSMLGILPIKVCFEIEEIRQFINANSSNDSMSSKL